MNNARQIKSKNPHHLRGKLSSGMNFASHNTAYVNYFNVSEYITSDGSVAAHYEYDPFGNTTLTEGPMADDFRFRFSSKYLDDETGLYYYGFRFYDPALGRWGNRDPIWEEGGLLLYGFVDNNGVNQWDLLGMQMPVICPPGTRYDILKGYCVPMNPPPNIPEADCSGYASLFAATCYSSGDNGNVHDYYPENAIGFCEGFKERYQDSYMQANVACVANCLIASEEECQDKYACCDDRNCCRFKAHFKCYAKCAFLPYRWMDKDAWSFGFNELLPSCL